MANRNHRELKDHVNYTIRAHIECTDNDTKESKILIGAPTEDDEQEFEGILFIGRTKKHTITCIHGLNTQNIAMAFSKSPDILGAARLAMLVNSMEEHMKGKKDGAEDGAE